jgi:serine protease Do
VAQQMYSCPNCHLLVALADRFCSNCGTPLTGQQGMEQQYGYSGQQKRKQGKTWVIVLGSVFAFMVLVGVIVGVSVEKPVSSSSPQTRNQAFPQNGAAIAQESGVLVDLPSFANLINKVEQSVVSINTENVVSRRFVQRTVQGAGSGWVIDESGIIVTNNHVIEGAKSIIVQTIDGKTYTPQTVKADPATDIAIIRINAGKLPALKVGDATKLRVGDWVLAVGNPLGMGISAKQGIISRLGVSIPLSPNETYSNLIETNAAINPGDSGGPLVNLAGEVVGITSLKLSTAGVEGMGYAIDIRDAMPVIQKLSE